MKHYFWFAAIVFPVLFFRISVPGSLAASPGEPLFIKHCHACHAGGGNIINPQKTLRQKDLRQNGLSSVDAIVKNMRHPGPGMLVFDEKTVSDTEARAIAEYILKTFK